MDLFLDTNIYLSFYKLSDDDLEELQKLTVAAESGDTRLYVTQQVRDEFARNREGVVADSLKAFEGAKLPSGFPRLLMNYPDYEEMRSALREYERARGSLLKEVREAAADWDLHADGLIGRLFDLATHIPLTDEVWAAAKRRYDLGNPPGKLDKKESYGDAINWESLLVGVPDDSDLLLVTGDTDYWSKLDESLLSEVLRREWAARKDSTVTLYKNLTSLFKANYPDIQLASELEKELAVETLVDSGSFIHTHAAIRRLAKYTDFSPEQVRALVDAAVSNPQISWIAGDEDVYDFFTQLVTDHGDALERETWDEFWFAFVNEGS